ncbi:MAG: O-antigen ligase family protein [Actinobacteria bacterium]|nr:O-antigen ligase family protein [Actinomycetota bacterium]
MSAPPIESDQAPIRAKRPGPLSTTQTVVGVVASGLGVAYLWLVIGRSIWMQYTRVLEPPIDWLRTAAWLAIPVIAVAVLSRRMRWPGLVLGALIGVWMGAGAVSSWRLTGQVDTRSLMLGMVCAGLFFGVAAARPAWTGWSIFVLGAGYVFLHVVVYYKSYYSLGQAFPGSTWWWSRSMWHADSLASVKQWRGGYYFVALPYPEGRIDRVLALVTEVPNLEIFRSGISPFAFRGLTGNGNLTGNFLAPCLAFVVPFVATRWRGHRGVRLFFIVAARIVMAAAVLIPGLFLLHVLGARSALAAVLIGLLVLIIPLAWSRNSPTATIAALVIPLGVLVPFILTRTQGISWSGRDCVWDRLWIPAIRDSPIWGIGPPGRLSDACAPGSPAWFHAHNEIFQAWSLGGLLGLAAAVTTIVWLAWLAVRYSDRDGRVLLAVMTCCMVLMGFEVLSSFRSNWVFMGIAWFIAIAGYSLSRMASQSEGARSPA